MPVQMRWTFLVFSIPFIVLAYAAFGGNRFTPWNLALGLLAAAYVIFACYQPAERTGRGRFSNSCGPRRPRCARH